MISKSIMNLADKHGLSGCLQNDDVIMAFKSLHPKQREYVLYCTDPANTPIDAALKAGYSPKYIEQVVPRVEKNKYVVCAKAVLKKRIWLENGIPKSAKRDELWDMATDKKNKPSERNNAMRSLMELDGDVQKSGVSGGGNFILRLDRLDGGESINLSIGKQKAPIEGAIVVDDDISE